MSHAVPRVLSRARALVRCAQDGCTALHYAAYSNREKIVQQLLKAGAKPDIADAEGQTPLMVAQSLKLLGMVALLKA